MFAQEGIGHRAWLPALVAVLLSGGAAEPETRTYALEVLPPEHRTMTDPETGAELTFLTTSDGQDTNLYFHERSWLADGSMILLYSDREKGGLMGYLVATGELIRFQSPVGALGRATAALQGRRVFAMRGDDVLELSLSYAISEDPHQEPSTVTVDERTIATLPEGGSSTALNENCDGTWLAVSSSHYAHLDGPGIIVVNVATGEGRDVCRAGEPNVRDSHVQWSHTDPHLLSFAGVAQRLWVIDVRDGRPRNVYVQRPGELVTHEHWWVRTPAGDEQIVFCGGLHPKPTEDSHVKVVNVRTGEVRILGAGSWWPEGTPAEISKRNYWHCAGSDDGHWVAADNWHGDITLFEGKTTRARTLTTKHRTYGGGAHPHVGWDRRGEQVVFTSHKLGSPDVCIATIPQAWQDDNPS